MKREQVEKWSSYQIAIFAGLFVLAILLINVSNYTTSTANVTGHATSFISDLFTQWSAGDLDINIAKYLFLIMLTALIFASLSFAKFPNSTFLQAILALPIGFLATAYITPSELFTILTSYSALGLTLGVIIPFVIMLFFSAMLLSNENIRGMTVAKMILQVALWVLFCGFLVYKLIAGYPGVSLSSGASIIIFIVLGLSLAILFLNKYFRKWIRTLGLEIRHAKAEVEAGARDLERNAGAAAERRP